MPIFRHAAFALAAALCLPHSLATASEPPVVEVSCLCKLGGVDNRFGATIAVDADSRAPLKALIERNVFGLRQTLVLRGDGCGRDGKLSGISARCGDNSLFRRNADGTSTTTNVPNTEFSGEVTIRITSTGGIPLVPNTPDDQPKVDDARWNSRFVSSISVQGVAQKVTPK